MITAATPTHPSSGRAGLRLRTAVKASGQRLNHNESGLRVQTGTRSGGGCREPAVENSDRVKRRTVVSRYLLPRFAIATVGASLAGVVGFSPLSGGFVDESVAAHDFGDASAVVRPIADFLENNPQSFNIFGEPIGNTGSDATVLLNFGWNSHLFPTIDRNDVSHANLDVFGSDPFAFPGGFDSILSETESQRKQKAPYGRRGWQTEV